MKITDVTVVDIRFPTSEELHGSDAMNKDPDYSAVYVSLETDGDRVGNGITFTLGRGNELCAAGVRSLAPLLIGKTLEEFVENPGAFWRYLVGDSQIRWVGPEKGVIHLATAGVVNALWDLWAKVEGKPLWKLLSDMAPEEIVRCVDWRHITDALKPEEALEFLQDLAPTRAAREARMLQEGYPAYTTSAGWLGYSDELMRKRCKEAMAEGMTHMKIKVGQDLDDDIRRAGIMREEMGDSLTLMMDANQVWDVDEAISNMKALARFNPWWIEEPTSPDDILGHKKIREAIAPIGVATGEMCHNRIMFKQFLECGAIDFCQIDSCRLGGVNEVIAVLLLARKFNVPVCPHAGGVGLCEYVQHLSLFDYIAVSGSLEHRIVEFVDHLHEHFVDPVRMENGRYMPPSMPGYSITMKPASVAAYAFPDGPVWAGGLNREHCPAGKPPA